MVVFKFQISVTQPFILFASAKFFYFQFRLWEHLSLNLHLYVKEEALTPSSISDSANDNDRKSDLSRKLMSSTDDSTVKMEVDTASGKEIRRDHHKRGQQDMFPLRSVVAHILHGEKRNKQSSSSLKQCDSSKTRDIKKRLREEDEQQPQKVSLF